MIGLGGGIIVVPVLTFLGFSPTAAASNSLFAALSNAVASTISYSKQKRIEYSLGLIYQQILLLERTVMHIKYYK